MPEEDKIAIQDFYEKHNIKHKDLTTYQQVIVFKRTINFIWIIAYYFDKQIGARFVNPMVGKDKGFGVVRTQSYIFYKDGTLLYELDHDYQEYKDTHTTQVENRKLLKRAYALHDKLDNEYLNRIGECNQNIQKFLNTCHGLLKSDDILASLDFIKE